jgi:hypothetical protein
VTRPALQFTSIRPSSLGLDTKRTIPTESTS